MALYKPALVGDGSPVRLSWAVRTDPGFRARAVGILGAGLPGRLGAVAKKERRRAGAKRARLGAVATRAG